jgi:hypothetical protein
MILGAKTKKAGASAVAGEGNGGPAATRSGERGRRYPTPASVPHLTFEERVARARLRPRRSPGSSHPGFDPSPARPDPITLLEDQATSRVPELVPIRYGRMLVSPFTFYWGAEVPMAADLATTPTSWLHTQPAATLIYRTSESSAHRSDACAWSGPMPSAASAERRSGFRGW